MSSNFITLDKHLALDKAIYSFRILKFVERKKKWEVAHESTNRFAKIGDALACGLALQDELKIDINETVYTEVYIVDINNDTTKKRKQKRHLS